MIHVGAQYYRPPFPEDRYWEDDFKLMADTGLNAVQLWVVWAWVESVPGQYDFSDYQRLVETAHKHGLDVVLSTIAAIHPYWIHEEEPGSEMINNSGHTIVSSNRVENHYGLTPGGCIDHPGVWGRMESFIKATAECFKNSPNVAGWDAWNELRWNVQSEGMVCYCEHTLSAFRSWLDEKYGGLGGLNEAWLRRYPDWNQVYPGIRPDRPFTEMMAFQEFITRRANRHALARYKAVKSVDPRRDVTVHGGNPTVLHTGDSYPNTALHRGNDWVFAEEIDGIGCSSFPYMFAPGGGIRMSDNEFFFRLESLRSAAGTKKIWISELQGGRGNVNFSLAQSVPSYDQQRWMWKGFSIGAEKILFWCWRDEVFGRESNGFGIIGNDGYREDRLAGLSRTSQVLRSHGDVVDNYKPAEPEVGILYSPSSIYLMWAQEGTGRRYLDAIGGYGEALQSLQVPYTMIEDHHLSRLEGIKLLFVPSALSLGEEAKKGLAVFVEKGGTLVCEPEAGAFSDVGLYSYPEDRWIHELAGTREVGRRQPKGETVDIPFEDRIYRLQTDSWITPFSESGDLPDTFDPENLIRTKSVGNGTVILLGAFLGEAAKRQLGGGSSDRTAADISHVEEFRKLISALLEHSGCEPDVRLSSFDGDGSSAEVHITTGQSGDKRVLFVFVPRKTRSIELTFGESPGRSLEYLDILNDKSYGPGGSIELRDFWCGMSVLASR